jgi:hypothetical protein
MTYNILDFKNDADLFNRISGQADLASIRDLYNQCVLIREESTETVDGLYKDSPVEVLDGAIDTLYVTLGLLQKLESLGMDVQGAMQRVALDNLLKFPKDYHEAVLTGLLYKEKEVDTVVTYSDDYNVYIIRDVNNKIRKPANFKATDLNSYVPYNLKEGFPNAIIP